MIKQAIYKHCYHILLFRTTITLLNKGRFQKKFKKYDWIYPSGLAGWGQQGARIHPKKIKKYNDDQNGLIHPEN